MNVKNLPRAAEEPALQTSGAPQRRARQRPADAAVRPQAAGAGTSAGGSAGRSSSDSATAGGFAAAMAQAASQAAPAEAAVTPTPVAITMPAAQPPARKSAGPEKSSAARDTVAAPPAARAPASAAGAAGSSSATAPAPLSATRQPPGDGAVDDTARADARATAIKPVASRTATPPAAKSHPAPIGPAAQPAGASTVADPATVALAAAGLIGGAIVAGERRGPSTGDTGAQRALGDDVAVATASGPAAGTARPTGLGGSRDAATREKDTGTDGTLTGAAAPSAAIAARSRATVGTAPGTSDTAHAGSDAGMPADTARAGTALTGMQTASVPGHDSATVAATVVTNAAATAAGLQSAVPGNGADAGRDAATGATGTRTAPADTGGGRDSGAIVSAGKGTSAAAQAAEMKGAAEAAQGATAKDNAAAGYAGVAAAVLSGAGAKDARGMGAGASTGGAALAVGAPAGAAPAGPSDPSQNPALNLINAAAAAPAGNPVAPARFDVAASVGDPGFGAAVSHPIVTMVRTGMQSAELSLNPEHFGPVSVSIQMTGREATVSISADHEATRTALREALPHLDALFAQNGLQLGGAHVGDGSERNAGRQGQPGERPLPVFGPAGTPAGVTPGAAPVPGATVRGATRLVDTFA